MRNPELGCAFALLVILSEIAYKKIVSDGEKLVTDFEQFSFTHPP